MSRQEWTTSEFETLMVGCPECLVPSRDWCREQFSDAFVRNLHQRRIDLALEPMLPVNRQGGHD